MMGDTFPEKDVVFWSAFEEEGGAGGDGFFPKIGMAPVAAARILPILFSGLVPFERLMNIPRTGKKD